MEVDECVEAWSQDVMEAEAAAASEGAPEEKVEKRLELRLEVTWIISCVSGGRVSLYQRVWDVRDVS